MVLGVDPCSFLAVDFDSPQIKVVVQHNMCILHCLQPANTSAYSHWLPQALYSSLYYKHAVALADWQNAYIEVYACLLLPISKGSIMDNGSKYVEQNQYAYHSQYRSLQEIGLFSR